MKKICIIGLGNMGQAIFEILRSKNLFIVDGFGRDENPNEHLAEADILIIAVKPQDFSKLAKSVTIDLSKKLAISIMAGISISKIKEKLKMEKVVRTLPNLALKIAESFTIWKASEAFNGEERSLVKNILQIFGEEFESDKEEKIEEIGAISGCGPAYFAFLAELIERSARLHGMSDEEASKMTKKILIGTAKVIEKVDWSASEFMEKVTSKGGSTYAAISHMQEQKFDKIFLEAIEKAIKRTKELNN